jgi:flavorubredoxin
VIDIGGKKIRYIDTPHVPHGWDAGLIYDETSRTLFCGDLFTYIGNTPPLTDTDLVGPAMDAEDAFQSTSLGPAIGSTIRRLADLEPRRLALMHGASFEGDCRAALNALARAYDERLQKTLT